MTYRFGPFDLQKPISILSLSVLIFLLQRFVKLMQLQEYIYPSQAVLVYRKNKSLLTFPIIPPHWLNDEWWYSHTARALKVLCAFLTHWGNIKWATLCRQCIQIHFFMKIVWFCCKFPWNLFPRAQSTMCQHWFRYGLALISWQVMIWTSTGHVYLCIYVYWCIDHHGFQPLRNTTKNNNFLWRGMHRTYCQISNIRWTLVGNEIVDHSVVVRASPVGAAPTTSSFSTQHLASIYCTKATASRDEKHLSFGI